jgi:nifR3 family TIM-barrel protein
LFEAILRAAVREAARGGVPLTIKMHIGIDDDHTTFLEAGRIAEDCGVAAVGLHARTAQQHYSGRAQWWAIGELKQTVTSIPVMGNGDIFRAADALDMIRETGCDGVVVGRGCQGRPWLFTEHGAVFDGEPLPAAPSLATIRELMIRHATLLTDEMGEHRGIRDFRKHVAWYLKGFAAGSEVRSALGMVSSIDELAELTARLDLSQVFSESSEGPRGRQGGPQHHVKLPEGWLDDPDALAVPEGAEIDGNGG